jgi:hypothetical protein
MKQKQKTNTQKQLHYWNAFAIIFIAFVSICCTTLTVSGHSPSTLTVAYDLETHNLRITISHQVNDPTDHYISKVEIKKNGAIYNTSLYTEQPNANSFSYNYVVNATIGDTIEVFALCNQGGSKTTQYTITQGGANNDEPETSTPGFELFIFLAALIMSIILVRKNVN